MDRWILYQTAIISVEENKAEKEDKETRVQKMNFILNRMVKEYFTD